MIALAMVVGKRRLMLIEQSSAETLGFIWALRHAVRVADGAVGPSSMAAVGQSCAPELFLILFRTAARVWLSSPHNPLPIQPTATVHSVTCSPCQSSKLPPQGCDALGGWQPESFDDSQPCDLLPDSTKRDFDQGTSAIEKLECPAMSRRHINRLLPSCISERAPTARLMRIQRECG